MKTIINDKESVTVKHALSLKKPIVAINNNHVTISILVYVGFLRYQFQVIYTGFRKNLNLYSEFVSPEQCIEDASINSSIYVLDSWEDLGTIAKKHNIPL